MDRRENIILDSLNEGVFTVDEDWKITSFNKAAERITGVGKKEAIGRYCYDVFRANICEHSCPLRRSKKFRKPVINKKAYIVNAEGERIPILISAALLKGEKGEDIGGVESFQDLRGMERLRKQLEQSYTFEDIIGKSHVIREIFDILPQISRVSTTVLIEGESGTGKELFARAIHHLSPRKDKAFVAVNCAALPETLLESELFGHKAGSFTDAKKDKPGRFELADGGTLFLDEIGDISPALQVRLLRALQEKEIEPVGALKPKKVDVRVLTATNKRLDELVKQGKFREDLYYRIKVIHLRIPPLRKRKEDVPVLIDHFINKYAALLGRNAPVFSDESLERLTKYDYPGNVRELENIVEQSLVLCGGNIVELKRLPQEVKALKSEDSLKMKQRTLFDMEREMIENALWRNRGNRTKTAKELGIDKSTLYRKIIRHGLNAPEKDGRKRYS